jgi:hypothetical protein
MSQAFNLSQFANKLNTSGEIDVTTGLTGVFPTSQFPTIPINKGGTNLTTVGANGTIVSTDGSAYTYGSVSGTLTWDTVKTSGFTAVANYGYFVNTTSGAITVTLPASPSIGQRVVIIDYAGTAATNNIIGNPNGSKINSGTGNIIISVNRTGLTFVYIDTTQGWLAQSNVYSGNPPFAQQIPISYLVVAGGGGGGGGIGGAGGAGGFLESTTTITPGITYTVTVGAGGSAGPASPSSTGGSGANSVISGIGLTTITSIGGGYGTGAYGSAGASGGSGGGGRASSGGSGTSGQGNAAGTGGANSGGGGGGAGAVGGSGSTNTGGNGGNGSASSITGSSVTYAGGGGGGGYQDFGGGTSSGGTGGGGGGTSTPTAGGSGTANLGGAGGGGGYTAPGAQAGAGGSGGSGVVILSVPTAQYTGTTTGSPIITTSGSNTIIKFNSSGTYTA